MLSDRHMLVLAAVALAPDASLDELASLTGEDASALEPLCADLEAAGLIAARPVTVR